MAVAQWIERWVADPKAGGSSPLQPRQYARAGQLAGFFFGEVSERLKELVSKTSEGVSSPWVRIPPSPLLRVRNVECGMRNSDSAFLSHNSALRNLHSALRRGRLEA